MQQIFTRKRNPKLPQDLFEITMHQTCTVKQIIHYIVHYYKSESGYIHIQTKEDIGCSYIHGILINNDRIPETLQNRNVSCIMAKSPRKHCTNYIFIMKGDRK